MTLLKKRQTAVVIFIAVVIVFSLIGAHRSINRLCRRAETAFYQSDELKAYDFYTAPIDHLDNAVKYANRLLAVTGGADALSEYYSDVSSARQALADAIDSGDLGDMYDAAEALRTAAEAMDSAVQSGISLPQSSDSYDDVYTGLISAINTAEQSPYNQYIDDYTAEKLSSFPTNILRAVTFVSAPQRFE